MAKKKSTQEPSYLTLLAILYTILLLILIALTIAAFVMAYQLNNKWKDGTICENCNCTNVTNGTNITNGWDNSYIANVQNGFDDSLIGTVQIFYKDIGSMKFFFIDIGLIEDVGVTCDYLKVDFPFTPFRNNLMFPIGMGSVTDYISDGFTNFNTGALDIVEKDVDVWKILIFADVSRTPGLITGNIAFGLSYFNLLTI
jgi:hypothetical protein